MADSASELESDTSSIDGGPAVKMPSPEQLQKRIQSLQQENTVYRMELETYKLKCKNLLEENKELRRASVSIQARAEQEEEYISNTLLKKIQSLKNEKETLARNYEQEEEFLTNDLSRKLFQLRQEKVELEETLEKEQEYQVNKLMRKIEKLEAETLAKQSSLEQLRREKVELENALEQEQEALVNRLWKRMDKLEAEKRMLQEKLEQPVSSPPSPRDMEVDAAGSDMAGNLAQHIQYLRNEVGKLRGQLRAAQNESQEKMSKYAAEERQRHEENLKLRRRLQMEIERREQLCRHLSESESSLEMDDERHFNEMNKDPERVMSSSFTGGSTGLMAAGHHHRVGSAEGHPPRPRTVSSPIPVQSPNTSRPISPGMLCGSGAFSPPSPMRCGGVIVGSHGLTSYLTGTSPPLFSHHQPTRAKMSSSPDKFVRPSAPPPQSPSPGAPPTSVIDSSSLPRRGQAGSPMNTQPDS